MKLSSSCERQIKRKSCLALAVYPRMAENGRKNCIPNVSFNLFQNRPKIAHALPPHCCGRYQPITAVLIIDAEDGHTSTSLSALSSRIDCILVGGKKPRIFTTILVASLINCGYLTDFPKFRRIAFLKR